MTGSINELLVISATDQISAVVAFRTSSVKEYINFFVTHPKRGICSPVGYKGRVADVMKDERMVTKELLETLGRIVLYETAKTLPAYASEMWPCDTEIPTQIHEARLALVRGEQHYKTYKTLYAIHRQIGVKREIPVTGTVQGIPVQTLNDVLENCAPGGIIPSEMDVQFAKSTIKYKLVPDAEYNEATGCPEFMALRKKGFNLIHPALAKVEVTTPECVEGIRRILELTPDSTITIQPLDGITIKGKHPSAYFGCSKTT